MGIVFKKEASKKSRQLLNISLKLIFFCLKGRRPKLPQPVVCVVRFCLRHLWEAACQPKLRITGPKTGFRVRALPTEAKPVSTKTRIVSRSDSTARENRSRIAKSIFEGRPWPVTIQRVRPFSIALSIRFPKPNSGLQHRTRGNYFSLVSLN